MNALLNKLGNRRIFLYGAGNLGKRLYRFLKNYPVKIECFLDKNTESRIFEDINILNPFENEFDKKNAIVIVSIFNRDVNFLALKKELLQVGFDDIISFIEFYPYCSKEFGEWYWLSQDKEYLHDTGMINSVYNLLNDSLSREIFSSIIEARKLNSYNCLPIPDSFESQYFSKDIPLNNFKEFIDCGAYDGDTIDILINRKISTDKIYAFEPDLHNFKKLADKIKYYNQHAVLFPCGVYSSTELLQFNSGAGEGSMIAEGGDEIIQCVSLDDALINVISSPTLLKMDIEGAELEALKGAKNLIENCDIDLAICLYHKPQDIIQIPKYLESFDKYDFYIRLYGYYGMELVLYAIKR